MKMPIIDISDSKKKMSSRQISAQRRNLIIVCRFAMKTLIDKAVLTSVDDESDEVTNFLAILEKILSHMIKPQKSWYGMEEPGSFWLYIQDACKSVPRSCISGISALDNVKPAIAKGELYTEPVTHGEVKKDNSKGFELVWCPFGTSTQGRAWLRCVLMEKRLSEYLTTAIHDTWLTRKYYLDGAIMLSEDVQILFAELLGLNAIDFSFCLKGDNVDLSTSVVVDYSPYLKFEQSRESLIHDEEELRALSMKSSVDSRVSTEMTDEELDYVQKYQLLDHKYRNACEQKGFLEEMLRLRENQLDAVQQQNQDMVYTFRQLEKENQKNRRELEGVIIELQEQLSRMKLKYAQLQQSLTYLPDYPTTPSKLEQDKIIPMEDLGSIGSLSLSPAMVKQMDSDQQSLSSLECSLPPVTSTSTNTSHHSYNEDTQSMIPLTGSLTSQQSMIPLTGSLTSQQSMIPLTGSLTSQQSMSLFTEPLTPQQSIKIYTGSHVSEENGQYTEYISFGPAFTKDIGAIAPMEDEDIDVITSFEHVDIDVITPSEDADIDVITASEHADIDVITPSEDADIDVITASEHVDIDVITPSEHADIDVISSKEYADIDVIASKEYADIDVITSFEHVDIDVITASEHADIDVITPSEDADIDVITPSEDADIDVITPSEDADIDVITPSEDADIDVITPSEDAGFDVVTCSEHADIDVITPSEHADIDVISSKEYADIDVIASKEYADIDVITSFEHADINVITPSEHADIDVIVSFEHVDRENQDSVPSPSMPPERTNQSKGSVLELSGDYLPQTDDEQRDKQTGTDKIVSSKDPNFINDNFPPAVEESFFVVCENPEAVGNQDSQPVEYSSHDSGVKNSGELNSESSKDQRQINLHSFANTDMDDSADMQTSQMLLAEIFEEMENLEQRLELEEKSASETSTMDESEFVFLDADG